MSKLLQDTVTPVAHVDNEMVSQLIHLLNHEEETEIDGELDLLGTAHGHAMALESRIDFMSGQVDRHNGLSAQAMQSESVFVGYLLDQLGARSDNIFPSMESFGDAGSRSESTSLAMEGIKDTLLRVWNSIKDLVASIAKRVMAFVSSVKSGIMARFGAVANSRDKLKELLKGVKKSSAPRDKTVKAGKAGKRINGLVNSAGKSVNSANGSKLYFKSAMDNVSAVNDFMKAMKKSAKDLKKAAKTIGKGKDKNKVNAAIKSMGKAVGDSVIKGMGMITKNAIYAGGSYTNVKPISGVDGGTTYEIITVKVDDAKSSNKDLPALTYADCETAIADMKGMDKAKEKGKALQLAFKETLDTLQSITDDGVGTIKKLSDSETADMKSALNSVKAQVTTLNRLVTVIAKEATSRISDAGSLYAQHVAASIDNLKKVKKGKKSAKASTSKPAAKPAKAKPAAKPAAAAAAAPAKKKGFSFFS